jgi:hypothetical protein
MICIRGLLSQFISCMRKKFTAWVKLISCIDEMNLTTSRANLCPTIGSTGPKQTGASTSLQPSRMHINWSSADSTPRCRIASRIYIYIFIYLYILHLGVATTFRAPDPIPRPTDRATPPDRCSPATPLTHELGPTAPLR